MKKILITLFLFVIFFNGVYKVKAFIPDEVKKAVAFIYTFEEKKKLTKGATGFFIGEQNSQNPEQYFVCLVTAKHVIQTDDLKSFLPNISVRLNTLDGKSDTIDVPVNLSGANQNVFLHDDPTVDLAVITLLPDKTKFDFSFIEANLLTTKDDFEKLNISEGSDVFFTSLFIPYMGVTRIYPIVRFGKVALIPNERVMVNGEKKEVYLIEAGASGGSSGAPTFVNTEESLPDSPRKLIGIISNHFVDRLPVSPTQTAPSSAIANIGIAIIEPAFKLQEILSGKEIEKIKTVQENNLQMP
ncbi:MAG: trypsin-like peptidase domain-containing protein [Pyrinomonadaceae bacterium]|nr:trypsin-like peptidase domain-containing protein [Pyrinomonadaceae bacterium]